MPPNVAFDMDKSMTFPYFPSVLYYIIFELLKNSMRAIVEFHEGKSSLPDVKIIVRTSGGDLYVKICDHGGGIKRDDLSRVWTYMFTTATPKQVGLEYSSSKKAPMAGFGYGLPLSRLVCFLPLSLSSVACVSLTPLSFFSHSMLSISAETWSSTRFPGTGLMHTSP